MSGRTLLGLAMIAAGYGLIYYIVCEWKAYVASGGDNTGQTNKGGLSLAYVFGFSSDSTLVSKPPVNLTGSSGTIDNSGITVGPPSSGQIPIPGTGGNITIPQI